MWRVPDGDDRERLTCVDCGYIAYQNPKMIVGAVCLWEGRYLLCRRAIEPRLGAWTIPAGYLELNEATAEGARRETWEEARAEVEIESLVGLYEIPRISQVYVVHAGTLTSASHAPGPESLETALVAWEDIPWAELAFPSIRWALEHSRAGHPPAVALAPNTPPPEA